MVLVLWISKHAYLWKTDRERRGLFCDPVKTALHWEGCYRGKKLARAGLNSVSYTFHVVPLLSRASNFSIYKQGLIITWAML